MRRILIVEDDVLIRRIYEKLFLKAGYATATAEDGRAALDLLANDSDFDLILLDIMMPNMNGFDFLAKVKEGEKTKSIPVCMLTNVSGRQTEVDLSHELGAIEYLVKSQYSPDELLAKVKSILVNIDKNKST